MKRSDGFEVPKRQSRWAIIFIVLKFLRRLFSQLWPILLAFFIGRGSGGFDRFEMAISAVGIFGMVSSIISYYKYYYYLTDEELVIEKGVLKKVRLTVPFERIQSINFNQNFLHQFLNVAEVEIETAGSDQSELQIDALDLETAERLRNILLAKKQLQDKIEDPVVKTPASEVILRLDPADLLKVGLVQNHFKPIGLLIGLVGSAFAYSYSFDFDPRDLFNVLRDWTTDLGLETYVVIGLLLIPISVAYSVVTTFLRHFNLEFVRVTNKFQVTQGMLTKKQFAALDKKIQIFSWGQNPIEKKTGLFNIYFRQARSSEKRATRMQFKIPGCNAEKVNFVRETWLGKDGGRFDETSPVSRHFFYRSALYLSFFFLIPAGISIFLGGYEIAVGVFLLWSFLMWLTHMEWKKKRYAFNKMEVYVGGGVLGYKHSVLPIYKIQNLSIGQNPYQWRRGLATLYVHSAAGHLTIPYITYAEATRLLDRFAYGVESAKRAWM